MCFPLSLLKEHLKKNKSKPIPIPKKIVVQESKSRVGGEVSVSQSKDDEVIKSDDVDPKASSPTVQRILKEDQLTDDIDGTVINRRLRNV